MVGYIPQMARSVLQLHVTHTDVLWLDLMIKVTIAEYFFGNLGWYSSPTSHGDMTSYTICLQSAL